MERNENAASGAAYSGTDTRAGANHDRAFGLHYNTQRAAVNALPAELGKAIAMAMFPNWSGLRIR